MPTTSDFPLVASIGDSDSLVAVVEVSPGVNRTRRVPRDAVGAVGPAGAIGPIGSTGPVGATGAVGPVGPAGTSITGIVSTADADALWITAAERIGIGTSAPDGLLHVFSGTAGVVIPDAAADDLMVENSGSGGISILTPAANVGGIYFGSPTASDRGRVTYSHNVDTLNFSVQSTGILDLAIGALQPRVDNSLDLGTAILRWQDLFVMAVAATTSVNLASLTASRALVSNGSKDLISSVTTLAELAFVNGVTSAIQTQLDSKGAAGIPQNSQSAAYTTVLADANKHILHPSADVTARTFTIDSNANVAYAIGTTISFVNQNGAGVLTIAITSDTMRLAGAGTTGSRTLAANGIATALKITATEWIINGTGLT